MNKEKADLPNIYSFKVKQINKTDQILSAYRNKVLLIVNTASDCRFTPQLGELQILRDQFKDMGFEVLAFPSNDFGRQEPLDGDKIIDFCQVNYSVEFPVFDKMMVRGAHAHPLFQFLADKKKNGKIASTPLWNFHKYLINKRGEVTDYFLPFTNPNSSRVKKKIQRLLQEDV